MKSAIVDFEDEMDGRCGLQMMEMKGRDSGEREENALWKTFRNEKNVAFIQRLQGKLNVKVVVNALPTFFSFDTQGTKAVSLVIFNEKCLLPYHHIH
jgi:hypothetical protein